MSSKKKPTRAMGVKAGLLPRAAAARQVLTGGQDGEMMAKPFRPANFEEQNNAGPSSDQEMPQFGAEDYQQRGHHTVNYTNYAGQIPPNEQETPDETPTGKHTPT